MSQIITLTLPDKDYNILRNRANKEKIRIVTFAAALLRQILEENELTTASEKPRIQE